MLRVFSLYFARFTGDANPPPPPPATVVRATSFPFWFSIWSGQ